MNKYIRTLIFLLLSLHTLIAVSKASPKPILPKLSVTFEVIIQDTAMINNGVIQFVMNKDDINSAYTRQLEVHEFKINSGKTMIVIPLSTKINYGRIDYEFKNQDKIGVKRPLSYGNNLFMMQHGDTITIVLSKNKVLFSGAGSEKYNLLYEINKIDRISKPQQQAALTLFNANDFKSYIKLKMAHQDSLYSVRNSFLESYRPKLNDEIYNLVRSDVWGIYNRKLVGSIFQGTGSIKYSSPHKLAMNEVFKDFKAKFNSKFLNESILVKSYRYCDFLIEKERLRQEFYNAEEELRLRPSRFEFVYKSIINDYTGLVRDKLILLSFYIGKTDKSNINEFFDDAISKTSNILYKQALIDHTERLSATAFPFALPDKDGNIHTLNDFKGKILILDFWYTGCPGCVYMAKSLKPIIKGYKSNPNIAFVSISIDGNKFKHLWLKSLKDEIYSSEDDINLLATEGKLSKIITHYNILGYPKLIVISKEGEVITTNPPDPRKDGELFKKFIDKNL